MHTPHSRTGVTFLEIVAVLVIIAITAAVIFPVFQKVHECARCPSCGSNLKQLGLAMVQYTQDANEVFPAGLNAAGNGWAGEMYPYVKSADVYRCPNDPQQGNYISYAENQRLVCQPLASLTAPAYTVALYEATTLNCDPSRLSPPENNSGTGISAPQNSTRHDPNTFGLFFLATDGHVKLLLPAVVSGGSGAVPTKQVTKGTLAMTFSIK